MFTGCFISYVIQLFVILHILLYSVEKQTSKIFRKVYRKEVNTVRVIKSRRMKWEGHVASMEEGRGVYRVLVGRSEGKKPLGRPRCRWEDNIKMDLREIGIDGANWIWLAQDRFQWWAFVSMIMNLRVSWRKQAIV
jgi:hypothetical protein